MEFIELPGGFEVPVPPQEIMVTAVTTAGASAVVAVGATLAATRMFEQLVKIFKPLFKTALETCEDAGEEAWSDVGKAAIGITSAQIL